MKQIYLLGASLFALFTVGTQQTAIAQLKAVANNPTIINDMEVSNSLTSKSRINNKALTICSTDTVNYPLLKATGFTALNINNATSASAAGQYYNANDSITVNGFDFFAWKTDTTNGITITITAELYLAGVDSLPTGAALATQSITIDTTFGGGQLSVLEKSVAFTTPVTVTQPYVIVVTNNSPTEISMLSNSVTNGDGSFEDLSSLNISGNWLRGSSVSLGGASFNADFLFYPHVDYNLNTDFSLNPDSLYSVPATINVTTTSDAIIDDRMYNVAALFGLISNNYDFGRGGGSVKVRGDTVTYNTLQNYTITLIDTIFQYNGSLCVSTETKVLAVGMTTGLSDNKKEEVKFSLFPNPSKGLLTVETVARNERVQIFGIDGKLALEKSITSNATQFNVSELSNGVYFVKVGDTTKKLIIKK